MDPRARGGALHLRTAGVTVASGLLAEPVRRQNALFFHRHSPHARPYVGLKLATSLDARIADGKGRSQWITGEPAREFAHWLRAGFDAIGVGLGTVRADNPRLTVRGPVVPLAPPRRIVFDRAAATPLSSELVRTARRVPTTVVVDEAAEPAPVHALAKAGVSIARGAGLAAQLAELKSSGIESLLVEGGGVLAGRLLGAGLVDRLFLLQAPLLLGGGGVPAFGALDGHDLAATPRWVVAGRRTLGDDQLTVLDRA